MPDDDEFLSPGHLVSFTGTAEPAREAGNALLAGYSGTTRASVLAAIIPFLVTYEGVVLHMYLDTLGLVTTGIGNLIDPLSLAIVLPWKRPDGSLASRDEITAVWRLVKSRQDMRLGGGVAYGRIRGNALRLDAIGLSELVRNRLTLNEIALKRRFHAFDEWPAAAQLGVHSMAWAMGPLFAFPAFLDAANATPPDFEACAAASHMRNGAPARNDVNRRLFEEAADVLHRTGDYDSLRSVDATRDTEPPGVA